MTGAASGWLASVAAELIAGRVGRLLRSLLSAVTAQRLSPSTRSTPVVVATALAVVAALTWIHGSGLLRLRWAIATQAITILLLAVWLAIPLFRLKSVGLVRADVQVRSGLGYHEALRLCTDRMAFLGVGAAKLTADSEFGEAVLRCSSNGPVRLLLCQPGSAILEDAARRAGRDRDEYQDRVLRSLRAVADLHKNRHALLDVRFYVNEPVFRLMFIDDCLCLASYSVMGESDGSQLPQLHIRPIDGKRSVRSFYWAFRQHYDLLWNGSRTWDFQEYL